MTSFRNWSGPRLRVAGRGLFLGLLAAACAAQTALAVDGTAPVVRPASLAIDAHPLGIQARRANFEHERPSQDARHIADWVLDSGDNRSMPFVIVDKSQAKVFVFDASGKLRGAAAALLGLAVGDDAVAGIGDRALSSIRPEERTTSAGRFEAALDRNLQGKEILWVDYDSALSLHPVITSNARERRAERLATPSPLDNRVSYGCINVPVKFYQNVVSPTFTGTGGIVYVLPETRSAREVFGSYDVEERQRLQIASHAVPPQEMPGAVDRLAK